MSQPIACPKKHLGAKTELEMVAMEDDEVLAKYLEEFGDQDGFLVHRLTNSVSQLVLQWRMFLFFFCGPKERVDVLNTASGLTSKTLQDLLWDNTLLTVRRLTDPETADSQINVSLKHLVRISAERGLTFQNDAYQKLVTNCKASRRYATKYIAHADFEHAAKKKSALINRGETTQAVKEICNFICMFHSEVRGVHYSIAPVTSVEDEQQFLLRLFQGNRFAEEDKQNRILRAKQGDWEAIHEPYGPDWLNDNQFRDEPFRTK